MIQRYGNIKQFSGQGWFKLITVMNITLLTHHVGVENNNNIAKRNYFSSNLHDVTGEVLKAEWRQEQKSTNAKNAATQSTIVITGRRK